MVMLKPSHSKIWCKAVVSFCPKHASIVFNIDRIIHKLQKPIILAVVFN